MNSEFHQLSEKINRLADLALALRRENAELRSSRAALVTENADLSGRMQGAFQRVSALLERIPAGEHDGDAA